MAHQDHWNVRPDVRINSLVLIFTIVRMATSKSIALMNTSMAGDRAFGGQRQLPCRNKCGRLVGRSLCGRKRDQGNTDDHEESHTYQFST